MNVCTVKWTQLEYNGSVGFRFHYVYFISKYNQSTNLTTLSSRLWETKTVINGHSVMNCTCIGWIFEQQDATGPESDKAQAQTQGVGQWAGAQPGTAKATRHGWCQGQGVCWKSHINSSWINQNMKICIWDIVSSQWRCREYSERGIIGREWKKLF